MASAATILYNGNVLTMTGAGSASQAIAIGRDGRIIAVGNNDEVRHLATANTRQIDLRGRTLLPVSSTAICTYCGSASILDTSI